MKIQKYTFLAKTILCFGIFNTFILTTMSMSVDDQLQQALWEGNIAHVKKSLHDGANPNCVYKIETNKIPLKLRQSAWFGDIQTMAPIEIAHYKARRACEKNNNNKDNRLK